MSPAFLIALVVFFVGRSAFAGETITAQEVEGYFYTDGEMKRSDPQFEITYYVEGDTVTRTRVYDLNKKEVIPDNTVYQIQRQLWSDPSKGLSFSEKPTVRAIGQPSTAKAAKALGLKRYFTGKPCNQSHIAERYTSTHHCVACDYAEPKWSTRSPRTRIGRSRPPITINQKEALPPLAWAAGWARELDDPMTGLVAGAS